MLFVLDLVEKVEVNDLFADLGGELHELGYGNSWRLVAGVMSERIEESEELKRRFERSSEDDKAVSSIHNCVEFSANLLVGLHRGNRRDVRKLLAERELEAVL